MNIHLHIDRQDASKNRLTIESGGFLGHVDLTSVALADSLHVDLDRDLPTVSMTLAPDSLTITGDVVLKVEREAARDATTPRETDEMPEEGDQ